MTARKAKTRSKKKAKKATKKTARKTRSRRVGARGLISRPRIKCIVQKIKAGNYAKVAAKLCGISESSYWAWLERGEKELERILEVEHDTGEPESPQESERLFLEFLEEISLADAYIEDYAVRKVKNGLRDPDIAMKFLGLRFKERWSRLQQHQVAGKDGAPILAITGTMTAEEATSLYQEKLKRKRLLE